jgi:hypothetical protein
MTERLCAYCDETTKAIGPLLTKYGWADTYECSDHGIYFILDSPMSVRGQQIGPTEPSRPQRFDEGMDQPAKEVCPWCDGVGRSGRFICEVCQPDAPTPVVFVPATEDDWR